MNTTDDEGMEYWKRDCLDPLDRHHPANILTQGLDVTVLSKHLLVMGRVANMPTSTSSHISNSQALFRQLHQVGPEAAKHIMLFYVGPREELPEPAVYSGLAGVCSFACDRHCQLPLKRLFKASQAMGGWLALHPDNQVLVQCSNGVARSGVLVSAFLRFHRVFEDTIEAMQWFMDKRCGGSEADRKLVHEQYKRYLRYFEDTCSLGGRVPSRTPIRLHQLVVHSVPNFDGHGGCSPAVSVYRNGKLLFDSSVLVTLPSGFRIYVDNSFMVFWFDQLLLYQDVLIRVAHQSSPTNTTTVFTHAFNTGYVLPGIIRMSTADLYMPMRSVPPPGEPNKPRFSSRFMVDMMLAQVDGQDYHEHAVKYEEAEKRGLADGLRSLADKARPSAAKPEADSSDEEEFLNVPPQKRRGPELVKQVAKQIGADSDDLVKHVKARPKMAQALQKDLESSDDEDYESFFPPPQQPPQPARRTSPRRQSTKLEEPTPEQEERGESPMPGVYADTDSESEREAARKHSLSPVDSAQETASKNGRVGPGRGEGMGPGRGEGMGHGMGPGQGEGMGPGQGKGQGEGMGPGMGPGQGDGMGMGPGQGKGQDKGMSPGQGKGQGEGMGPGQGIGPESDYNPDIDPVTGLSMSGLGRGLGKGQGQGMGPGMGKGMGPGQGQGQGQGMGPGQGQGMGPGKGEGEGQGMGPGQGEGQGQGMGPGKGQGLGEGLGKGAGPGMGPGQGQGMGPGMGPGMGTEEFPDEADREMSDMQISPRGKPQPPRKPAPKPPRQPMDIDHGDEGYPGEEEEEEEEEEQPTGMGRRRPGFGDEARSKRKPKGPQAGEEDYEGPEGDGSGPNRQPPKHPARPGQPGEQEGDGMEDESSSGIPSGQQPASGKSKGKKAPPQAQEEEEEEEEPVQLAVPKPKKKSPIGQPDEEEYEDQGPAKPRRQRPVEDDYDDEEEGVGRRRKREEELEPEPTKQAPETPEVIEPEPIAPAVKISSPPKPMEPEPVAAPPPPPKAMPPPPPPPPPAPPLPTPSPPLVDDPNRIKVKHGLHWNDIRDKNDLAGTMWADMDGQEDLDSHRFQDLFCVDPKNDRRRFNRLTGDGSASPTPSTTPAVIDIRRAQNIGIGMSRFYKRHTNDDIRERIAAHQDDAFSLDDLYALKDIMPTAGEQKVFSEYEGPREVLVPAEQFLKDMSKEPGITWMTESMLLEKAFDSDLRHSTEKIETTAKVLKKLCESKELKKIMKTTLDLGNLTNFDYGRAIQRQKAHGFRVDSLPNLKDVWAVDRESNLTHYLSRLLEKKSPEALEIHRQFPELKKARGFELKTFLKNVDNLKAQVEAVKEGRGAPNTPATNQFRSKMEPFLHRATSQLEQAERAIQDYQQSWSKALQYFGEKEANIKPEEMFGHFEAFMSDLDTATKQLRERKVKAAKTPSVLRTSDSLSSLTD